MKSDQFDLFALFLPWVFENITANEISHMSETQHLQIICLCFGLKRINADWNDRNKMQDYNRGMFFFNSLSLSCNF